MKNKWWLMILLLVPSTVAAQGVPASGAQRQDLFQFYTNFFIQQPGRMHELNVFRDGTVLHGNIVISGMSDTTTTDPIGGAQAVVNTVRQFFSIPNDYQFVLQQGGFSERKPIETIGTWKNVIFALTVDGVPLEKGYVEVMFDEQGFTRSIGISVPRLRPEIVASVRGPIVPISAVAISIRLDANALPPNNVFGITPNTDLKYVDLKKVALAEEPYIVYQTFVNSAAYTVNAKTGAVMSRVSLRKH